MKVSLKVNGTVHVVDEPPVRRLLDVLRSTLRLTGTKEGCGEGECGTCAVMLDGDPVNACLVAIGQCDGRQVTTVEGLAQGGRLLPLQQAMSDHGGAQCGICTPGMLVAADALLTRNRQPTEAQIRRAIGGNLCRCTGYERIVQSIHEAARLQAEQGQNEEGVAP